MRRVEEETLSKTAVSLSDDTFLRTLDSRWSDDESMVQCIKNSFIHDLRSKYSDRILCLFGIITFLQYIYLFFYLYTLTVTGVG
jgi:hypothetical protein